MPYKDPERKRRWEQAHRKERTERRRAQRRQPLPASTSPSPENKAQLHGAHGSMEDTLYPSGSLGDTDRKSKGSWWGLLLIAAVFFGVLGCAGGVNIAGRDN